MVKTIIIKEIRRLFNIKPSDKIFFYIIEGRKVILKPLHGKILELQGSVPSQIGPADFENILKTTRKKVAKKMRGADKCDLWTGEDSKHPKSPLSQQENYNQCTLVICRKKHRLH
jgi:bifunctional DNA-binding transcriptional regulator/antitoxin component of YhaV-PrlF toxin-antitoxin module